VKESDAVEIEKEAEQEEHPQKLEPCKDGGSSLLFQKTGDEEEEGDEGLSNKDQASDKDQNGSHVFSLLPLP
jgi:hypothetical protein